MRTIHLIFIFIPLLLLCGNGNLVSNQTDNTQYVWNNSGNTYQCSDGHMTISTSPTMGGRITSCKIADTELLQTSGENTGSTFWPSPQSSWPQTDWPPPPVLDNSPYSVSQNSSALTLKSEIDNSTGFQFSKTLSLKTDTSAEITYSITNKSSSAKNVATWEVTRVLPGGLIFFPAGSTIPQPSGVSIPQLYPTLEDSIVWIKHISQNHQKLYRDGSEMWIAYVYSNVLFVKVYDHDITPAQFAPQESEIEVYASSSYLELEIQGPYIQLQPEFSADLKVKWYVRDLPTETDKSTGSKQLIALARKLAGSD